MSSTIHGYGVDVLLLLGQLIVLLGQLVVFIVQAVIFLRQVKIAKAQVKLSERLAEQELRPLLALQTRLDDINKLQLINVGRGPALDVRWWWWPEGESKAPWPGAPAGRSNFVLAGCAIDLNQVATFLRNPPRKVYCTFKSADGAAYASEHFRRDDSMVGQWFEDRNKVTEADNVGDPEAP